MKGDLERLLEEGRVSKETRLVAESTLRPGGVDPLGLREINFGLMDRVFPNINNTARHIRPYILMAWAWRRVRHLIELQGLPGSDDQVMRDFVDRIEAIYSWSQFLRNPNVGIPGGQAMRALLEGERYRFGGDEWRSRRDTRRYSTGLISPLNYGPSLRTMGWLHPVEGATGVFQPDEGLSDVLDKFEALMCNELSHPAFCQFGEVEVAREDAARWGKLWAIEAPLDIEGEEMFARLAGDRADETRRQGVALVRAAVSDLANDEIEAVRERMADPNGAWGLLSRAEPMSVEWRAVQVRQVFRLALEGLFYWTIAALDAGPLSSESLSRRFLDECFEDEERPVTANQWLFPRPAVNPVVLLRKIEVALSDGMGIESAVVAGLAHCLNEAPSKAQLFETTDRLPLARAREEADRWGMLSPAEFMVKVFEVWLMAQHAYWCVGRGIADARNGGKTILRLRIVMDEGGWTLTPGTAQGSPPQATPDRLETVMSLLAECGRLAEPKAS